MKVRSTLNSLTNAGKYCLFVRNMHRIDVLINERSHLKSHLKDIPVIKPDDLPLNKVLELRKKGKLCW